MSKYLLRFQNNKSSSSFKHRVSDATGELSIEEAAKKPLKKEDLDTDDCFILDTGPTGVFSWIGKGCTINEKKAAMNNAMVSCIVFYNSMLFITRSFLDPIRMSKFSVS